MSRPREFDTRQALNHAMNLFWHQGFHATTTRDLVREMSLGQQSIYNAFGDKKSLYNIVLDHYEETVLTPRLSDLEKPEASKQEIVRFLAHTVEFLDLQNPRKGCFACNAAVNTCFSDKQAEGKIQTILSRMKTAFRAAIENATEREQISQILEPSAVAQSLVCTVLGMSVSSRVGSQREQLVDMASTALRPLY